MDITDVNETELDIYIMSNVKNMLDREYILTDNETQRIKEFKTIRKLVKNYMQKYCSHNIIQDSIDITPEKSINIYYCSKCMMDTKDIQKNE
jgi:hypothetical protein